MAASVWPELSISPIDERPLLERARLRPFGLNYLEDAICPALGLLAHPDGTRVLLLPFSPGDDARLPPPGVAVSITARPTRSNKRTNGGRDAENVPDASSNVSPVRALAWTDCSAGEAGDVRSDAAASERSTSCHLAVAWGSEIRLWKITKSASNRTYDTAEVAVDWNAEQTLEHEFASTVSDGGSCGNGNGERPNFGSGIGSVTGEQRQDESSVKKNAFEESIRLLSFRPTAGSTLNAHSQRAVPLAAWHDGGATLFGPGSSRALFSAPVFQKRTCGAWSGCGKRLAVGSGGEIRIYNDLQTEPNDAVNGHGNLPLHKGSEHSASNGNGRVTDALPEARNAATFEHGSVQGGSLAERDEQFLHRSAPGSTAGDSHQPRAARSGSRGVDFHTILCAEAAVQRHVAEEKELSSGSQSSLPPSRSPSPDFFTSVQHTSSPKRRNLESVGEDSAEAVGQTRARATFGSPTRRRAACIPAVFSLAQGSRELRRGGSGESLRSSAESTRPSHPARLAGDMRAMCPAGRDAFLGTTDGGMGLDSLASGLGMNLSALSSSGTSTPRHLNDSFSGTPIFNRYSDGDSGHHAGERVKSLTSEKMGSSIRHGARADGGNVADVAILRTTNVGAGRPTTDASTRSEDALPPSPPLSGRRGGIRHVLPSANWQAGPLRPRLKGKEPPPGMLRSSKLQPSPSVSDGVGVVEAAQAAVLALGMSGGEGPSGEAHKAGSSASSHAAGADSDEASSTRVFHCGSGDGWQGSNDGDRHVVDAAGKNAKPFASDLSMLNPISRERNSTSPGGLKSPSQCSSPTLPEIVDLRGKFGGGTDGMPPAVHPLFRLPLSNESSGIRIGTSSNTPLQSTVSRVGIPKGGSAAIGERGMKRQTWRSTEFLPDEAEVSRQPMLVRVIAGRSPSSEQGKHAVVETLAVLPPALASPDLIATSDDGTFVCVGSHACGSVACYRVTASSSQAAPPIVASPPSASASRLVLTPSGWLTFEPTGFTASNPTDVLVESNTCPSAGETKNCPESVPSPPNTVREAITVMSEAHESNDGCSKRLAHGRRRVRSWPIASPMCTLQLPPGLRAKGLAFAQSERQVHRNQQQRQFGKHGAECQADWCSAETETGDGGRAGENHSCADRVTAPFSVDDVEGTADGIVVLVLAAAPASVPGSSGSNPTFDMSSRQSRTAGGGSRAGSSTTRSSYRTVLLRFQLPSSGVVGEEGAAARASASPKCDTTRAPSVTTERVSRERLKCSQRGRVDSASTAFRDRVSRHGGGADSNFRVALESAGGLGDGCTKRGDAAVAAESKRERGEQEPKTGDAKMIVDALDRLEERLGERLDGIERMLWDVAQRVGSLERAVGGTAVVAKVVSGDDAD